MYLSLLHTEENQAAPSNTHQPYIPCSKVCWVWYQSTGIGMEILQLSWQLSKEKHFL